MSILFYQFVEPSDGSGELGSDPALLRTMIRDLKENLEIISKVFSRSNSYARSCICHSCLLRDYEL